MRIEPYYFVSKQNLRYYGWQIVNEKGRVIWRDYSRTCDFFNP